MSSVRYNGSDRFSIFNSGRDISEGDQPMVLALNSSGNTVDTSLFPHLHTIIQDNADQGTNTLTLLGPNQTYLKF